MLEGLLQDLNSVNVDYLISDDIEFEVIEGNECNPIRIPIDLSLWLEENISEYDACLFLAPEDDFTLYYLTRIIEDHNVMVIGSNSEAVWTCSDKLETYTALKDKVPFIKSDKIFFNRLKEYKTFFNSRRDVLVKPADGVSCQGVMMVQSYGDFIKASARLKRLTKLPYFILQDFIHGVSISVSVLTNGETAIPLSCNLQNISLNNGNISYTGGEVPFEHESSIEAINIAKQAVESLNGLKGYVGVDMILDEETGEVRVIELNPRLTTPYVALRRLLNFNLADAIINSVNGELPGSTLLNGKVIFQKEGNHLTIEEVIIK